MDNGNQTRHTYKPGTAIKPSNKVKSTCKPHVKKCIFYDVTDWGAAYIHNDTYTTGWKGIYFLRFPDSLGLRILILRRVTRVRGVWIPCSEISLSSHSAGIIVMRTDSIATGAVISR